MTKLLDRSESAVPYIVSELEQHICDQQEEYMGEGMDEDSSLEKAIAQMGDPVSVGADLDRIHRPKMPWLMLAVYFAICLCSGILIDNRRHLIFCILSAAACIAVCHCDFSLLGKYGGQAAVVYFAVAACLAVLDRTRVYYIDDVSYEGFSPFLITQRQIAFLGIPVFAGVLYWQRNKERFQPLIVAAVMLLHLLFSCRTLSLSVLCIVFIVDYILLSRAVRNRWLGKYGWVIPVMIWTVIILSCLLFYPQISPNGQLTTGLTAWFHRDSAYYDTILYETQRMHKLFAASKWIGKCAMPDDLQNYFSIRDYLCQDYVLAMLCVERGRLIAVTAAAGIMLFITILLCQAVRQRNQIGQFIGISCGVTLILQGIANIMMELDWIPPVSVSFPLVGHR